MANRFLFISTNNNTGSTTYNLRDTGPAGGLIFYINPNAQTDGWTYLESSLGLSYPVTGDTQYRWSNVTGETCGSTGSTVGAGSSNTSLIINQTGYDGNSAAKSCDDFSFGGYSDWYLPSKDELNYMYQNLHLYDVGYFTAISYWTSTEYSNTHTYRQTFSTGAQSTQTKSTVYRFRPIRKF